MAARVSDAPERGGGRHGQEGIQVLAQDKVRAPAEIGKRRPVVVAADAPRDDVDFTRLEPHVATAARGKRRLEGGHPSSRRGTVGRDFHDSHKRQAAFGRMDEGHGQFSLERQPDLFDADAEGPFHAGRPAIGLPFQIGEERPERRITLHRAERGRVPLAAKLGRVRDFDQCQRALGKDPLAGNGTAAVADFDRAKATIDTQRIVKRNRDIERARGASC